MSLSNPDGAAELRKMRENLSNTITTFVDENGSTALKDFDKSKFDKMELHEKIESRRILNGLDIAPTVLTKWFDDKNLFNFNSNSSISSDDSESE